VSGVATAASGAAAPPDTRAAAGVALVLLVCGLFAGMDTTIRHAAATLPVLLLLFVRYLFQATLMGALIGANRRLSYRAAHPRFQWLRGVLLLGCSAMNFVGLKFMPVAEFTSIAMLAPVLVVLLAAMLLKERVTPLRWALVGGAWLGALVVIRPGSGLFGWAVVFPLLAVMFYAAFQLVSARLAHAEHPLTTQFWTGAVGTLLLAPLLLAQWADLWPVLAAAGAAQWALMLLIAALGTFGHLLFLQVFRLAPASTIAPLTYVQMAWAALLGWLVFGHLPDAWSWLGMAIVAGCGAATAWLNVRRAATRSEEPIE
jgi:drug/metabolite transporter (DMT)-like permease